MESFRDSFAYTLSELVSQTNPRAVERALNCKTFRIKNVKADGRFIFYVKCKESYSKRNGHVVSIVFDTTVLNPERQRQRGIEPKNLDVRLMCSCPYHQFYGPAYTSTQLEYNFESVNENRAPDIRDPDLQNLVCKHVVRVKQKTLRTMRIKQLIQKYGPRSPNVASVLEEISEEDMRRVYSFFPEVDIKELADPVENFLARSGFEEKFCRKYARKINANNVVEMLDDINMLIKV